MARVLAPKKQDEQTRCADFCRIFDQEMRVLYMLAILLTGDNVLAEECFIAGLEDCLSSAPVFKELP